MRLTGTQEWIVIGVLIAYIAFTPGFPMVRQFLSTGLGKAIGLGVVVWTWKNVSQPVALLLLVNFVRCSGMREYLENGSGGSGGSGSTGSSGTTLPPNTYCQANYSYDNGQCKNDSNPSQTAPATVCLPGQSWDGTKCTGSSSSSSSSGTKQSFTNMTPGPYGGVQPSMKDDKYAPA